MDFSAKLKPIKVSQVSPEYYDSIKISGFGLLSVRDNNFYGKSFLKTRHFYT